MSAWLDRLELEAAKVDWERAKKETHTAEMYDGPKPGPHHRVEAEKAGIYIRLLEQARATPT